MRAYREVIHENIDYQYHAKEDVDVVRRLNFTQIITAIRQSFVHVDVAVLVGGVLADGVVVAPFMAVTVKNPLHAKSKISLKLKKFINLKFSGRMVTK